MTIAEVSCPKNSIYNVSKILFGFFFITSILKEFNSNQDKIEDADAFSLVCTKATGFTYCEQNRNLDLGWFWAGFGPVGSTKKNWADYEQLFEGGFCKFSEANEIL